jgi:hypothetical protein
VKPLFIFSTSSSFCFRYWFKEFVNFFSSYSFYNLKCLVYCNARASCSFSAGNTTSSTYLQAESFFDGSSFMFEKLTENCYYWVILCYRYKGAASRLKNCSLRARSASRLFRSRSLRSNLSSFYLKSSMYLSNLCLSFSFYTINSFILSFRI